jgi:hypothetical protein
LESSPAGLTIADAYLVFSLGKDSLNISKREVRWGRWEITDFVDLNVRRINIQLMYVGGEKKKYG